MYCAICMFDLNLKMKRAKELALIYLLSLVPALFYLASFILLSHLFLFTRIEADGRSFQPMGEQTEFKSYYM